MLYLQRRNLHARDSGRIRFLFKYKTISKAFGANLPEINPWISRRSGREIGRWEYMDFAKLGRRTSK